MTTDTKRGRGPNYSKEEVTLLISIIADHKDVIENKKTDALTCKDKERTWIKIAKHFNSSTGILRTMESLKKVYDNRKKEVRKKSANIRMIRNTTGLGVDRGIVKLDDSDALLLSIINTKTVDGIPVQYGGDAVPSTSTCSQRKTLNKDNNLDLDHLENKDDNNDDGKLQNAEVEELHWGNFRSSHLQTPLHNDLRTRIGSAPQTWTARRRPVASAINASELSKEYSALVKLKLECSQIQLDSLKHERENQIIESRLRQDILRMELKSKEIDVKIKEIELAKTLEK